MTRPTGAVSELEWQIFLRDEVTKRFPGGFTVWEAQGQWQSSKGSIDQERSKVLLLRAYGFGGGTRIGAATDRAIPETIRSGIGVMGNGARLHIVVATSELAPGLWAAARPADIWINAREEREFRVGLPGCGTGSTR